MSTRPTLTPTARRPPAALPRSARRSHSTDGLAEQEPEREDVGSPVDGQRHGRPSAMAAIACSCSGDIQPGVPPSRSARALARQDRALGEVEIQQHRLAVHRDQDVRRLDVHVDQAPRVGIVERIGETRRDPGHRLDIGRLLEAATKRPVRPAAWRSCPRVAVDRP